MYESDRAAISMIVAAWSSGSAFSQEAVSLFLQCHARH